VDNPRIEDLRRRVEKDPASIAFAQLGEEYRRAGCLQEAVEICRAGLARHPGYLSARVTLGRALVDLGHLDDGERELEMVLASAPENLSAIRGLAEIHHRRGSLDEALTQYKAALGLARNDPDLQETIGDLERKLGTAAGPKSFEGLSYDQVKHELAGQVPAVPPALTPVRPAAGSAAAVAEAPPIPAADRVATPAVGAASSQEHDTVAALDEWLTAIHVTRSDRRP
jgi:tetratricopeptide (TPR) repeat protein